ncbi:cytoskeletal protein binding protein [Entomophthora muscae]|uniref:Cytoskeletal protein binding protein n=1 Tax=Entomophthora muscae TaxID=34485 RepID=A0ACC2S8B9_9FUNG|nr:cytoskeletal protein binding protein [Entomophthora muscae]
MSAIDVHYVSEVIGQDLSANFEAAKRERAEVSKWKEFFLEAGVSPSDAATYANKFTHEKIDRQLLRDMDRPTLKGLGLTEGDALRVEKACQKAKAAEEDEAFAQRLQQEEVDRLRKETGGGNLREYQIEQDAMLARKLQQETDSVGTWQNFPTKANESRNQKYGLGLGNKTGRPSKGVNPNALFEASAKLQEENLKESPKAMTKITTKKSTPQSGFTDDIWAVPGEKPAPRQLALDPSGIPQLQSKSWDAFGAKAKDQAEKPLFTRKDSSRPTKPSEIEEKWGFVQANFEHQTAAKPEAKPEPPEPAPQAAPSFKPAGPLAQPLIPVPRGGNSNVFVPTRRPPPPKPAANVFADNPASAPNIGAAAGVTTRVAPKPEPFSAQPNLFNAALLPASNNSGMAFSSQPTNLFSEAPKSNPTPSNMFSGASTNFSEAPFSGATSMATGFIDNSFVRNQPNNNIFGNQTSSRPASTNTPSNTGYQFDDLSLESLGLKPAPVANIVKPEARPHSAMGLQSNSFYGQQEPTSFSFADFSQRPGNPTLRPLLKPTASASQGSLASHNAASSFATGINKSTESFSNSPRNDLKPISSNYSAAPSRNDYQTGYLSDASIQFSGSTPNPNANMPLSSNYPTSRAPAGGSLAFNQPAGFSSSAYTGNNLNQTSSFAGSNANQGGYPASNFSTNQDRSFSGSSLNQPSNLSTTGLNQNYSAFSNNPSYAGNTLNQNSSFSTNNFNQTSSFSASSLSQNYPGNTSTFSSNNPSQSYAGNNFVQLSSFPASNLNQNTSLQGGYSGNTQSYSGNNLNQTGNFTTAYNSMTPSLTSKPDYSTGFASNTFSGGYSSNLGGGAAQGFRSDFGSGNMSNPSYPGTSMGMNGMPPQNSGSSYSAFSGVDPLNSGNTPNYPNQPPNQPPPMSNQQYYQQSQSRFYPN